MISRWMYDADYEEMLSQLPIDSSEFSGRSVLVTGATGLIGTCLTEFFLYLKLKRDIDLRVVTLSRSAASLEERFGAYIASGALETIEYDLALPGLNASGFAFIVHAASVASPDLYVSNPVGTIMTTMRGMETMLEAATRSNSKLVYLSTVEVYGSISSEIGAVKETEFGPLDCAVLRNSYPEAKRLAETLCCSYSSQFGTQTSILRLSKVYGPSVTPNDNRVMAAILRQAARGEQIRLQSDGSRIFSFCYVTDAVSAIVVALLRGASGEAYNVSDDSSVVSLREVAEVTAEAIGEQAQFGDATSAAVSSDTVVDSSKLRSLGWRPLTPISVGLIKQIKSVKNAER